MGSKKKYLRATATATAPDPKPTRLEMNAILRAKELNLFLLCEGSGNHRVWRIWNRTSGQLVGRYFPCSRGYCIGDRNGRARWPDVLLMAAAA